MTNDEMRAVLAAEVMGWSLYEAPDGSGMWWYNSEGVGLPHMRDMEWNPTDRLEQAMNLLRFHFWHSRGWIWHITNAPGGYTVTISNDAEGILAGASAPDLAYAICKAVLLAKGLMTE